MKVETRRVNPALVSIYKEPNQVITLDANFLIPPDREAFSVKAIPFDLFRTTWLDPIFKLFPALAIHEAVQDEVVSLQEKAFIQEMLDEPISKITILKDSQLSSIESILRATIEEKIFTYTHYDPDLDNSLDRGEVKTLSYIAAKGLPYFAAHDNNAI